VSDLISKKITKRKFLEILGLSSASLLTSGALADELLAEMQDKNHAFRDNIPVVVTAKPNAFQLGRSGRFSNIIVFPKGYKADNVDVSSIMCEGAYAVNKALRLDDRTIVIPYEIDSLRNDLLCGFGVQFNVTGKLSSGIIFEGSGKFTVIARDQTNIYHTSTRRRKSCNACKNHAMNRIYSSRQAADLDRAHSGCSCRIVEENIGWQNYVKAFWRHGSGDGIVYNRRWCWPPPLPEGLDLEYPSALEEHLRRG
jgi:hypothetical protein